MLLLDPNERRRAYEHPDRNIEPMGLADNGPLIDREYQFTAPGQWARELLINGIEAGATRIRFGIDWHYVDYCIANGRDPIFRMRYQDNGHGMHPDTELAHYFNKLSASSRGFGEHGNYGVGAKISLLPWNKAGLVVMTWQQGDGGMIAMTCGKDGNYGVIRYETENEHGIPTESTVIVPPEPYRPLEDDTGVSVVCYGNSGQEHTYYGSERDGRSSRVARATLERRIFALPESVEVVCEEIALAAAPRNWPHPDPRQTSNVTANKVQSMGALLEKLTKPDTRGTVAVTEARVHWWLMDPVGVRTRSSGTDVFSHTGTVATLYRDDRTGVTEVYDLLDAALNPKQHSVRFRFFGVPFKPIQQRLVFLVEPQKRDESKGIRGVSPDPQRRGLAYEGGELPWTEWGEEFMAQMPTAIREAVNEAYSKLDAADPTSRVKPFLDRMRYPIFRPADKGKHRADPKDLSLEGGKKGRRALETVSESTSHHGNVSNGTGGNNVTRIERPKARVRTSEVNPRTKLPKVKWIYGTQDVEIEPGAPATYDVTSHTVFIDGNFAVFSEVREHYAVHYPNVTGIEMTVKNAVETVYGAKYQARIFHAWSMKGTPGWTEAFFQAVLSDAGMAGWVLGLEDADESIRRIVSQRHGALKRASLVESA